MTKTKIENAPRRNKLAEYLETPGPHDGPKYLSGESTPAYIIDDRIVCVTDSTATSTRIPAAPVVDHEKHTTRESWLAAFIEKARPQFELLGSPIPEKVRASCGFTSKGRGERIGECWSELSSSSGHFEMFISPELANPARVAGVLTHELVHAAAGLAAKHGPKFRKLATALGLEGKMTATTEGAAWHAWADKLLDELGEYPHSELGASGTDVETTGPKPQKNRHHKIVCNACGFAARATNSMIEQAEASSGGMICVDPTCDGDMERA